MLSILIVGQEEVPLNSRNDVLKLQLGSWNCLQFEGPFFLFDVYIRFKNTTSGTHRLSDMTHSIWSCTSFGCVAMSSNTKRQKAPQFIWTFCVVPPVATVRKARRGSMGHCSRCRNIVAYGSSLLLFLLPTLSLVASGSWSSVLFQVKFYV